MGHLSGGLARDEPRSRRRSDARRAAVHSRRPSLLDGARDRPEHGLARRARAPPPARTVRGAAAASEGPGARRFGDRRDGGFADRLTSPPRIRRAAMRVRRARGGDRRRLDPRVDRRAAGNVDGVVHGDRPRGGGLHDRRADQHTQHARAAGTESERGAGDRAARERVDPPSGRRKLGPGSRGSARQRRVPGAGKHQSGGNDPQHRVSPSPTPGPARGRKRRSGSVAWRDRRVAAAGAGDRIRRPLRDGGRHARGMQDQAG